MRRVIILCEGYTEDVFVREVMSEHLQQNGIYVTPIIVRTSKIGRGGVTSYAKIKRQVERLCRSDTTAIVTTMIDLYALPNDFPSYAHALRCLDPINKVTLLEDAFLNDVGLSNFHPYIQLYEFEALLFSEIEKFRAWFDDNSVNALINDIGNICPEHVNNSRETAPSKRIERACVSYDKVTHGPLICIDIGLSVIRAKCEHFNQWLTWLEGL